MDGSQTLFTVLAAINAAGYDANLDSNANSPVRKQVREAIAQKHLASVEALRKFFVDHHQEDQEAELSQYISFALSLQGPPDFQFWMPHPGGPARRPQAGWAERIDRQFLPGSRHS